MKFREYLQETIIPVLPSDINKNFLKTGTIQYKKFNIVDENEKMVAYAWVGELPRNKGYGVVFASFDAGFETRTKIFTNEEAALRIYNQFKDNMDMFEALKMVRR